MIASMLPQTGPATASERSLTPEMRVALEALVRSSGAAVRFASIARWFVIAFLTLGLLVMGGVGVVFAVLMKPGDLLSFASSFLPTLLLMVGLIVAAFLSPRWLGGQCKAFEQDLAAGVYHEVVGEIGIGIGRRSYRVTLNGDMLPLGHDAYAMQKFVLDGPSSMPGGTVRYLPTGRRLMEIETADGRVVYRDPALGRTAAS